MAIFNLVVLLSITAFTAGCPRPQWIEPCTCVINEITCQSKGFSLAQMTRQLKNEKIFPFRKLKLRNMNLGTLKIDDLDHMKFFTLEITNCQLQEITDALSVNPPLTKTIIIELSIDEHFSEFSLDLHKLKNLAQILLMDNYIKRIQRKWFPKEMDTLKFLSISKNQVQFIEDRAFEHLTNLTGLVLSHNQLKYIMRNMLPYPAKYLSTLNLGYNELTHIPEDLFAELPSLKMLDLRFNRIQHLPEKTWGTGFLGLQTIHLKKNPLDCSSDIEWIVNYPEVTLSGRCASPKERRGIRLVTMLEILRHGYIFPQEFRGEKLRSPQTIGIWGMLGKAALKKLIDVAKEKIKY